MATTVAAVRRPPSKPLDLEITVVSGKHLKNINWRNGDLNPYAIFWLDPDRRLATKSDDSNSTKPVWNERFLLPLPSTPDAAVLTLEIFHAKPSDTPKPLVGTLRVPIGDLPDLEDSTRIRTFELRRPSGRPDGKIRLKLALRLRHLPDYQSTPQPQFNYTTAPPPSYGRYHPSSPSPYGSYSSLPTPPPAPAPATAPPSGASPAVPPPYHYVSHSDPYSLYYQGGYYTQPPPPPPLSSIHRQFSYVGPSAPVDFAQYDQQSRAGKMGSESGFAVGAITGGLGGLAIDEGLRYGDQQTAQRVETDTGSKNRDDYSDYRRVDY